MASPTGTTPPDSGYEVRTSPSLQKIGTDVWIDHMIGGAQRRCREGCASCLLPILRSSGTTSPASRGIVKIDGRLALTKRILFLTVEPSLSCSFVS